MQRLRGWRVKQRAEGKVRGTCGRLPHDLALLVLDQLAPLQQPPENVCRCVLQERQLLQYLHSTHNHCKGNALFVYKGMRAIVQLFCD